MYVCAGARACGMSLTNHNDALPGLPRMEQGGGAGGGGGGGRGTAPMRSAKPSAIRGALSGADGVSQRVACDLLCSRSNPVSAHPITRRSPAPLPCQGPSGLGRWLIGCGLWPPERHPKNFHLRPLRTPNKMPPPTLKFDQRDVAIILRCQCWIFFWSAGGKFCRTNSVRQFCTQCVQFLERSVRRVFAIPPPH